MSDPSDITSAIEEAEAAFDYRGVETVAFEEGIDQDAEWKT